MNVGTAELECWFLTGSQHLYGEETLREVAAQSAEVVRALNDAAEVPVRIVPKPVLTGSDEIRQACLEANAAPNCVGVIAWMHTFSPAKAWIAGLEALQQPLLHLHTQANASLPWATIDMDFMNLNQSAHGDREFGYITTRLGIRRKVVAGHVSDPATRARIGSWLCAATGWRASRKLRVARFGDSMRDVAVTDGDRVEAQRVFGWSIQAHSASTTSSTPSTRPRTARSTNWSPTTSALRRRARAARRRRAARESLRDAARIEAGLRSFLCENGFDAFTTNFQDLGGLSQLPGIAVAAADGRRLRIRRRRRLEDRRPAPRPQGHGPRPPGGTSFMEDYTYHFGPGDPLILGAHMLEICPSISSRQAAPRSIRWASATARTRSGSCSTPTPAPASWSGSSTWATASVSWPTRLRSCAPPEPLPNLPVARATWKPDRASPPPPSAGSPPAGPPHGAHHPGRARGARGPRHDRRGRARMDRRDHHHP